MDERVSMLARAEEHLLAAETCMERGLANPAYELARTAAELFGKVLLLDKAGTYPREHNVAGELNRRKLIPSGMSPAKLSRFLDDYTRGSYGFDEPVEPREARQAIEVAKQLRQAIQDR